MAKDTKDKKVEKTIDAYTGEEKPVPEDADKFIEVVPTDNDDRRREDYLSDEETSMDTYAADADADATADLISSYTDNEDIKEDFADRQHLGAAGRKVLEEELDEHNSKSPKLSGGDVDAAWERADVGGEETVGGTAPTPDQDSVDELGRAAGLTYADDEPLQGGEKLLKRDRHRAELEPPTDNEEEDTDEEDYLTEE
jgi:Family of unknown function (DUF6335)